MSTAKALCKLCGAPMQLSADGRQYQCMRAPTRHPTVRARSSWQLQGGWNWAVLVTATFTLVAAVVWWAGLRSFVSLREPLLVAVALGLNGFVAAYAAAFAFRMHRPSPHEWNGSAHLLGLGLLTGAPFAGVAMWAIFLMHKDAAAWPLLLAVLGWALGVAAAFLPYSVVSPSPAARLVERLSDRRGREWAADAPCAAHGCGNLAISCEGRSCQRKMCGTHWIQAEGRCNSCGHSFLAQHEAPQAPQVARVGLLAVLAVGWLAVMLGGYFFVRWH